MMHKKFTVTDENNNVLYTDYTYYLFMFLFDLVNKIFKYPKFPLFCLQLFLFQHFQTLLFGF